MHIDRVGQNSWLLSQVLAVGFLDEQGFRDGKTQALVAFDDRSSQRRLQIKFIVK